MEWHGAISSHAMPDVCLIPPPTILSSHLLPQAHTYACLHGLIRDPTHIHLPTHPLTHSPQAAVLQLSGGQGVHSEAVRACNPHRCTSAHGKSGRAGTTLHRAHYPRGNQEAQLPRNSLPTDTSQQPAHPKCSPFNPPPPPPHPFRSTSSSALCIASSTCSRRARSTWLQLSQHPWAPRPASRRARAPPPPTYRPSPRS
jgi:hypothetical protein